MKIIQLKAGFIITTAIIISLTSCNRNQSDESTIEQSLEIKRFEEDLFSIKLYNLADSIDFLEYKYPRFFPLFTNRVISIGDPADSGFSERLLAFVSDFTNYQVSKRVKEVFPSLDQYAAELSKTFGRFKAEFPEQKLPEIVTCITGFNQSIITDDSLLSISLDKYLGVNEEFYTLLYPPVPEYMRLVMRPEKIVPDAIQAWIITSFTYNDKRNNLLSTMIYTGRYMYCLKKLMPEISDTLIWGFTSPQMVFCKENERSMWEYLVENKKLFITDQFTLNQFINEAPFTKDFTRESPGRAVVWLGYRIVESYANRNGDLSLKDIMTEDDYQKILNSSKYNP
jgi:hypothetical protein